MPQHIQKAQWSLGHWLPMEMCLFRHLAAALENHNIATSHLKCFWVFCPFSLPVVISVEILKWKHPCLLSVIGEILSRWNIFTRGQVRTVFLQEMCAWTGLCWCVFISPWRQFLCDEWGCHNPSLWRRNVRARIQAYSLCLEAASLPCWCCLSITFFWLLPLFSCRLTLWRFAVSQESVVSHGVGWWSSIFKLAQWCRKETAGEKKLEWQVKFPLETEH